MGIATDLLSKLEQKNGELGKKLRVASKYAKAVETVIEEEAPAIRDRIKARMEELQGKKPAAKKPEPKPTAKKAEAKKSK